MNESELVVGCWYHGEGRFIGGIGLWTGSTFLGFQRKFGQYLETSAVFGERGFSPVKKVEEVS